MFPGIFGDTSSAGGGLRVGGIKGFSSKGTGWGNSGAEVGTWVRCQEKPQISKKRNSILRKISTAIKASYYNKILATNNLFD